MCCRRIVCCCLVVIVYCLVVFFVVVCCAFVYLSGLLVYVGGVMYVPCCYDVVLFFVPFSCYRFVIKPFVVVVNYMVILCTRCFVLFFLLALLAFCMLGGVLYALF